MIDVKKAGELAKAEMRGMQVCECLDIGDSYAFSFCAENGELIPGTPIIIVAKKDGAIDYMSIPPLENLELLNKGKEIEFE